MPRTTHYAAACLAGGIGLAVGTPVYVAYAARDLAGYLLHPSLLLIQTVPFVLCGALWLPWRTPETVNVAGVLATVLLVAAVIVYTPILWAPGARGGDMIALAYLAISAGLTIGVLIGSALAFLVIRRRHSRSRP